MTESRSDGSVLFSSWKSRRTVQSASVPTLFRVILDTFEVASLIWCWSSSCRCSDAATWRLRSASLFSAPKVIFAFTHAHSLQVDHQVVVADASNQHDRGLIAKARSGAKTPVSGVAKYCNKKDYKKQGLKTVRNIVQI